MNKILHYLLIACLFTVFCGLNSDIKAQTPLEPKHSYTFEDGTAADVAGNADATVNGGTISEGVYTASTDQDFITLPAGDIQINTFSAITLEALISTTGDANPRNTMLAYFGDSPNGLGANGYFMQLSRGDNQSRTAISTGNLTQPWTTETGVMGPEVDSEGKHHVVSILTDDSIAWYVDGVHAGTAFLADDAFGNSISKLSNNFAWLGKAGYSGDAIWKGSIYEFNIYEGVLDPTRITERAETFLSDTEPTLSDITVTVGGENYSLDPNFSPNVTEYKVKVPNGTTTATVTATPTYESSTVVGDGDLTLVDGSVTTEIVVTTTDNETKTYELIIEELSIDATLTDITVMVGEEAMVLSPEFDPTEDDYTVSVPFGTTSFNVAVTTAHPAALAEGAGNIEIVDGRGVAEILVTAEDGETTKPYKVTALVSGLENNADLQTLSFAQGNLSPAFDPEITDYSLVLNQEREFVNVFAKTAVKDATLEGEAAEMTYVTLNEDGTATATFTVTAINGRTKTYTVNISTDVPAPTAIGNDINSPLRVYPTVSTRDFTVDFAGATGKVTVYDLSGKIILEKTATTSKISVNVPGAGMYIFHLESKGLSKKIKAFKVD